MNKQKTEKINHGLVRLEQIGKFQNIALFTLDRPEKANAYTDAMVNQFMCLLDEAIADSAIHAAIITGAGKRTFCSGADTYSFAGRSYTEGLNLLSRRLFDKLAEAPWPTIAAIFGPAIAGGLELALACDMRICNASSWFALPEVELNLVPAAGGLSRLPQLINPSRAKEIILFGRKVDAVTALEWGLVAKISEDPLADALDSAEHAVKQDDLAMRLAKMALQAGNQTTQSTHLDAVSQALLYYRNQQNPKTDI